LPEFSIRDKEPRGGNILRRYETIFIALADLSPEEMEGIIERYKTIITSQNGVVVRVDKWGKRKLAYPIQKRNDGNYILIDFVGEHEVLVEFERNLKYDENILRFQSVNLSDKVDMEEIEREIADAREEVITDVAPEGEKIEEAGKESGGDDTSHAEEPLAEPAEQITEKEEERVEE